MVKVRKVGSRGTRSYVKDEGPAEWSGDAYRKVQKEKLGKIGKNLTIHLGRGVRTAKLKDLPEPKKRPSTSCIPETGRCPMTVKPVIVASHTHKINGSIQSSK